MSKGGFYGTGTRAAAERAPSGRPRTVRAAIIGGTGYGGMELLRLVMAVTLTCGCSSSSRSSSMPP